MQLSICESGNIKFENLTKENNIVIDFKYKELKASDIYDVLVYSLNNEYIFLDDKIETIDPTQITYFKEVKAILEDIVNDVNIINGVDVASN